MEKELYIFDMDGTILNTIEDITNAVNYILQEFDMPQRSVEEVKYFVGNGLLKTLQRSVPETTDSETVEKMYPLFVEYYKNHSEESTRPYDGIVEVIQTLRRQNKKVAVVSNKRVEAVRTLCEKFFQGCFDISLGDQEGIQIKPAPDMVDMVIDHYQLPKEKVVYIGDSDVDLLTAKNAQIDCIAVAWGFRDREFLKAHDAKVIIDTPQDLLLL